MGRKSMVVNFFTDADWFTFSPAEMVNFLAAINKHHQDSHIQA
jgi:hypothetical protein